MASYTYNTRFSLIKAGRVINNKIIISLAFIWSALLIGSIFLFLNNTAISLQPNENKLQVFAPTQADTKNNDGAFVFVVRNKQMTLTRYKGFIDKGKESNNILKPVAVAAASQKSSDAAVVLRQKHKQEKQPDFSVRKVPVQ